MIAVTAVVDDEAADVAGVDLDVQLALASQVVDSVEGAAEHVHRVLAAAGRLGDRFVHAGERVHAVDQQVAVHHGTVDRFGVGGVQIHVARIVGDEPEVAVAVVVDSVGSVDRDDARIDLIEGVGRQHDLARAFVVGGVQADGVDVTGVELAFDRQAALGAVDDQRADFGDVAHHLHVALDHQVVEVAEVGVHRARVGHEQSAGAADDVAGTVDFGEDGFFFHIAFVVEDRGLTVGTAGDFDRGVAVDNEAGIEVGCRDDGIFFREVAGREHEVHVRGDVGGFPRAVELMREVGIGHDQLVAFRKHLLRGLEIRVGVLDGRDVDVFVFRIRRIPRIVVAVVDDQHVAVLRRETGVLGFVFTVPVDVLDRSVGNHDRIVGGDQRVLLGVQTGHIDRAVTGEFGRHVDERLGFAFITRGVDVNVAASQGHRAAGNAGIGRHVHCGELEGVADLVLANEIQDRGAGVIDEVAGVAVNSLNCKTAVHSGVFHREVEVRRDVVGVAAGTLSAEAEAVVGRAEDGVLDIDVDRAAAFSRVTVEEGPPLRHRSIHVRQVDRDFVAVAERGVFDDAQVA